RDDDEARIGGLQDRTAQQHRLPGQRRARYEIGARALPGGGVPLDFIGQHARPVGERERAAGPGTGRRQRVAAAQQSAIRAYRLAPHLLDAHVRDRAERHVAQLGYLHILGGGRHGRRRQQGGCEQPRGDGSGMGATLHGRTLPDRPGAIAASPEGSACPCNWLLLP
ncbi:hypothetical protein QU38_02250, partial [Staphylococcus aureus]